MSSLIANCYRIIVAYTDQYTALSSRNAQLSQLDLVSLLFLHVFFYVSATLMFGPINHNDANVGINADVYVHVDGSF